MFDLSVSDTFQRLAMTREGECISDRAKCFFIA